MKNKYCLPLLFLLLCSLTAISQKEKLKKLDVHLSNYQYPYPVGYFTLNIQNQQLQMAFMDVKPEKPIGKNVLLLHGKNFNGAYWKTTIQELVKNGYRVIVPDQIGFGKSTKPPYFQYSFHQLAQNTKMLLDSLGVEKTAVIGHSMGGMVAARFALMYPDVTEKLVLEDPIGLEDYQRIVPYQTVEKWYQSELKKDYEALKKYQQENYYGGNWKPAYDEWLNLLAGWTLSENYPLIAWNAALTYDMIMTQPIVYELPFIQSPTLLIIGERDRTALGKNLVPKDVQKTMGLYPELGRKTQAKIPNAQLELIENTGHLPHIESFGEFIQPLLSFLGNAK